MACNFLQLKIFIFYLSLTFFFKLLSLSKVQSRPLFLTRVGMAKTTHAGVELVLLNPPICPNLPQMCVYTYALTHSYMYLFFSTFMVTIFLYISSLSLQHLNNLIGISKTSSTCLKSNLPHYCPSLVSPAPKRWQDGDGHPRNHDPTSACLIAFLYLTLNNYGTQASFFF